MSDFNWPAVVCLATIVALYTLLVWYSQRYHDHVALKHARERLTAISTVDVYPRPPLYDQDAEVTS